MNSLIKNSMLLAFIAILIKALGFVREIIFAKYLGTSEISDAYILGITVSQIVIVGMADTLFKVYLPVATEQRMINEESYIKYTKYLLINSILFLGIVCWILLLFSDFLVTNLSKEISKETLEMAKIITKVTIIPSVCFCIINICQGYLHIQEKFWINFIYPVLMNLIIIYYLMKYQISPLGLAWSYSISLLIPSIILLIIIRAYGMKFLKSKNIYKIKHAIKKTFLMSVPLFVGGVVPQINEVVDRYFALNYADGVLTALRYGKLLEIFIVSIVGIPVSQAVYPKFSVLISNRNYLNAGKLISILLTMFIAITFPIILCGILLGEDLIQLLLMRGKFNLFSLKLTSTAYIFYSFSILPVCFSELLSRCLVSLGATKKIVLFSSLSMGLNIILNYFCVKILKMDYYVLALTTSLSEIFLGILFYKYTKKCRISIKLNNRIILNVAVSSVMTFFLLFLFEQKNILFFNFTLNIIIKILIGIVIYIICMNILNFNLIIKYIRNKTLTN